jgi:cytidylate kinase
MYRALTLAALDAEVDTSDDGALADLAERTVIDVRVGKGEAADGTAVQLNGKDVTDRLRRPDVEEAVSMVSRVRGVRDALVKQQRIIAEDRAIVMAGRDIGTVVLPDADLKLYLDASIQERAGRRHREFETLGRASTHDEVLSDIRRRDQIDTERDVSPLRPASDALIINTDGLTLQDVMERVLAIVAGAP